MDSTCGGAPVSLPQYAESIVETPLEQVIVDGRLAAIIVRDSFRPEGIQFVTPTEFSQQLGFMRRPAGYQIQPHIHQHVERETTLTQEVLYVRVGRVRVDFYGDDETLRESREIRAGDVILLSAGGHGFAMLEDSELIEVKQGPYLDDKRRFQPR